MQRFLLDPKNCRSVSTAVTVTTILFAIASVRTLRADDWMTWPSTYTHDMIGNRVDQHTLAIQPVGPTRDAVVRSGYRHFRSTLQVGNSADNYHVTEQWGAPVVPYEHWRFPFRPYGVPYDAWGPPTPLNWFQGGGIGVPYNGYSYPNMSWDAYRNRFGSCRDCGNATGPGFGFGPGNGFGPGDGFGPGYGFGPGNGHVPGYGFGQGYGSWPGFGFGNGYGGFGQGYGQFPLQPSYQNQPWFDGSYPSAPPLN